MKKIQAEQRRRLIAVVLPVLVVLTLYVALYARNALSRNTSISPDGRMMLALRDRIFTWDSYMDVYYQPTWLPIRMHRACWFRAGTLKDSDFHFSWQRDPDVVSVWRGGRPLVAVDRRTGKRWPHKRLGFQLVAPEAEKTSTNMLQHLITMRFSADELLLGAIQVEDLAVISALVETYGADVNAPTSPPPLQAATHTSNLKVMAYLLSKGATPDPQSSGVLPPLCIAASRGDIASAKLLLDAGASIDYQLSGIRRTALHCAVDHGRLEMVRFLVMNGARTDLETAEGQTAADVAKARGAVKIVAVLQGYAGRKKDLQPTE